MVWNAGSSREQEVAAAGGCDDCRRMIAELLGWGLIAATLAGWAWVVVVAISIEMRRG